MRIFPTGFAAELAKKTGAAPIWILRQTINSVDYWLSDSVYTIDNWDGSTKTTQAVVSSWGNIMEKISGALGEILISDLNVSILVDQSDPNNIATLAYGNNLETSPYELYLWFYGLNAATDPPQMLFRGYAKDISVPDETVVDLIIEDENSRLQNYLGNRITKEAYPLADPDDVGTFLPIVFGSVSKLPARCVDAGWVTSLPSDIASSDYLIQVSEVPDTTINKIISIDDEQLQILNDPQTPFNPSSSWWGGTAYASSEYAGYPTSKSNDGNYSGSGPSYWQQAAGGTYWHLANRFKFPTRLYEIYLFSVQDNYQNPAAVDHWSTLTGSLYVIQDFDLYYCDDDSYNWQFLKSVRNNDKIVCRVSLDTQVVAKHILVVFLRSPDMWFRVVELEAWGYFDTKLYVTRGFNGSTAVVHTKGSTVVEKKTTPLVYLVADHPLDAISQVFARFNGIDVDISSDCTTYLGTPSNQLDAHPGKAAITIPDIAHTANRIALAVQDTIAINDSLHTHAAGTSNTTTVVSGTQGINTTTGWASINLRGLSPGYYDIYGTALNMQFPSPGGTILTCTLNYVITCPAGSRIMFGGITLEAYTPRYSNTSRSYTFNANQASAMNGRNFVVSIPLWEGTIYSMYTYDNIYSYSATASVSRNYTYNSTTSANVSVSQQASGVSKAGTVTLSGNSVSDVAIGSALLVNCNRNSVRTPFQVINWLLTTFAGGSNLVQVGTLPDYYLFNGAIIDYRKIIDVLDTLSFQCGCFFRRIAGVSKLIVRQPDQAAIATISACCLTTEGIKDLSSKKAPITDVINTIKLMYHRDWSSIKTESLSFVNSAEQTDAGSIAAFGALERPEMFMFDFVTDSVMASDLAALYIRLLSYRPWIVTWRSYLDKAAFEFADVVALPFANDSVGQITEVGFTPGSEDVMDSIQFSAVIQSIQTPPVTALMTLDGEYLATKDKEYLIYV